MSNPFSFGSRHLASLSHPPGNSGSAPNSLRWVLQHKLAVGGIPTLETIPQFQQAGILAVLTLCADTEGTVPSDFQQTFRCDRLFLPDSHYPDPIQPLHLQAAVEHVRQTIQQQQPIYVHCLAGVERSPLVCITYLCLYEQLELWEALRWVKQVNPRTKPTQTQLQVVQHLLATQE